MSDQQGVPMICATSVMKPGRARIGRISKDITLPRTVPIVNLVAAGVGMFAGLVLALAIGNGISSMAMGMGFGGGAGWMAVTYSPLQNESLLKWFELKVKSQTRARYVNGRRVTLAVGTGVVAGPSSGAVRLVRSAVRVTPGQYDERGAVRSVTNRNLESGSMLLAGATLPPAGARMLPVDEPTTRRTMRVAGSPDKRVPTVRPSSPPAANPAVTGYVGGADVLGGPVGAPSAPSGPYGPTPGVYDIDPLAGPSLSLKD